jgi:hypothetical protein
MFPILMKIGASLLFQLLTESFVKQLVAVSLKWAAEQTHTEVDDKMVEQVKTAWNIN